MEACESSLEKEALQKIVRKELKIPDSAQKIIYDDDGAPIAKPDFYYEDATLAVFVDGPAHDRDYIKQDDEQKRSKLKELGCRVHVIYYQTVDQDIEKLSELLG
jgi:very-short-patch-repair endonuclease